MAKTTGLNTASPVGTDQRRQTDEFIVEVKTGTVEILTVDHQMGTAPYTADADGEHKKVTFTAPLSAKPTLDGTRTSMGALYTKDAGSPAKAELYFEDEDGDEVQLTSGGKIAGASLLDDSIGAAAIQLAHDVALKGLNHAGAEIPLIMAATGGGAVECAQLPDGAQLAAGCQAADDNLTIADKGYVDTLAKGTPAAYVYTDESVTFPNSMIMKTGVSPSKTTWSTSTNMSISFAVAFTDVPRVVFSWEHDADSGHGWYPPHLYNVTKDGFTVVLNTGAGNWRVHWMAIGK
jgi:hypothetical protein